MGEKWYLIKVLICFLITRNVVPFHIYLLAICTFFLAEMSIQILCLLSNWVFCFLLLTYNNYFYIGYKLLIGNMIWEYSFQSVGFLITFIVFWITKVFFYFWLNSIYQLFFIQPHVLLFLHLTFLQSFKPGLTLRQRGVQGHRQPWAVEHFHTTFTSPKP